MGARMRDLPLGARVGGWFFCHSGNTEGDTLEELEEKLQRALKTNGWSDKDIIGNDSILDAREWYKDDPDIAEQYADALGVSNIVFGHDPNGLGPAGDIVVAQDGVLFRTNTGMSPEADYSKGELLRVRQTTTKDVAESLEPDGNVKEFWQ